MKKIAFVIVAVIFIVSVLCSCSKNICPAYTYNDTAENTEVIN